MPIQHGPPPLADVLSFLRGVRLNASLLNVFSAIFFISSALVALWAIARENPLIDLEASMIRKMQHEIEELKRRCDDGGTTRY